MAAEIAHKVVEGGGGKKMGLGGGGMQGQRIGEA